MSRRPGSSTRPQGPNGANLGLLAPPQPGRIVQGRLVLTPTASGQCRGAGGAVTSLELHVVGQGGLRLKASRQNRAEAPWSRRL